MSTVEKRPWLIFLGAIGIILLINIDVNIVNLALAKIGASIHATLLQMQWIVTAYLLTTVIFFLIGGKLADMFGHKRIYLIGIGFFLVGSLLAGLTNSYTMLIIGRLLQGVGFALALNQGLLMISHAFPDNQRGMVMGMAIAMSGVGQAIGPTLGGVILELANWHWIFLVNVPICLFSLLMIWFYGKNDYDPEKRKPIDYFGVVLMGLGVTLLLLAFSHLTHADYEPRTFLIEAVVALIILILFVFYELKIKTPLVDFHLFKVREYSRVLFMRFMLMFVFGGFALVIPLLLQNIWGETALIAGLVMLVFSACFGLSSPFAGVWADNLGYNQPLIVGNLLAMLAYLVLALTAAHLKISILILCMVLLGFSFGLLIPTLVNGIIVNLPKNSQGEGLGMSYTIAFIATAIGVSLVVALIDAVSGHQVVSHIPAQWLTAWTPAHLDMLHQVANGSLSAKPLGQFLSGQELHTAEHIAHSAFKISLEWALWVWTGCYALAFLASLMCFFKPQKRA